MSRYREMMVGNTLVRFYDHGPTPEESNEAARMLGVESWLPERELRTRRITEPFVGQRNRFGYYLGWRV